MNDDIVQSSGRPEAVNKKQPNIKLTTQEFIIKSNRTHNNKYNLCKDKNIDLIHIFEFENLNTWKKSLIEYLSDKNKYSISFSNIKRDICFYKKDLTYYGQSYITHID